MCAFVAGSGWGGGGGGGCCLLEHGLNRLNMVFHLNVHYFITLGVGGSLVGAGP